MQIENDFLYDILTKRRTHSRNCSITFPNKLFSLLLAIFIVNALKLLFHVLVVDQNVKIFIPIRSPEKFFFRKNTNTSQVTHQHETASVRDEKISQKMIDRWRCWNEFYLAYNTKKWPISITILVHHVYLFRKTFNTPRKIK